MQTALAAPPANLGGRVAYLEWDGESQQMVVANLDGSDRLSLGQGIFPNLSPAADEVIYSTFEGGLAIRGLPAGEITALTPAVEGVFDIWPMRAPDGSQIAFERVTGHTADIYLLAPDGSNLRPVVNTPEDERLLGWSPDSNLLYYQVTALDGAARLRTLDVSSGVVEEIGSLPLGTITARLSPDGARLVYFTLQGTYLSAADGSDPVLLLAATPRFTNQMHPSWSPDGNWLALAYWETPTSADPGLALVNVSTCQAVLLPQFKAGWISSWVP